MLTLDEPYERSGWLLALLIMLILGGHNASALESQFDLELRNTYIRQHNYLDGTSGEFDRDIDAYLISITPSLMMFCENQDGQIPEAASLISLGLTCNFF